MKKNKWLFYLVYAIVLSVYVFFAIQVITYLTEQRFTSFNNMPLAIVSPLVFVVLGFLIGAGHLISQRENEGRWKINLPQIIFIGIPLLYFSFGIEFWIYNASNFISEIIFAPFRYIIFSNNDLLRETFSSFSTVFKVLLGYIIITSIIKTKVKNGDKNSDSDLDSVQIKDDI